MPRSSRIMLIALIAFAAAFRAKGLFANTFQPDEALFASWARYIATWRDPLLVGQLVDKPPLLFYLQALFFRLFGPEMWAARLPAFIASLALIPMTAQLAWRLYQSETTMLLAAAIVVSSPMAIQYSASGFIDPLTSFLLVGMLVLVADFRAESSGRIQDTEKRIQDWAPILAGVFFGLAALSKFQAWLFIPLMVALAMIVGWRRAQWRNWLIGLLPFLGLQVAWELLRTGKLALLEAQLQSYGGLRLSWSWELWPRLNAWADQWAYILKSPVLELMLLLALPLIAALLLEQHDRKAALDRLFVLYVVAHTLLLWFVAVPVWDRYLLALLPIIGLVLSRAIERAIGYILLATSEVVMFPPWTRRLIVLAPLALLGLQASPIAAAYEGELAIGASPTADQGAAEVSQTLLEQPYGTVLYDHWFSWQWRYHLFDSKVYISWFPDAESLLEDLEAFGGDEHDRFIALPYSEAAKPVKRALIESGYSLLPVASTGGKQEGRGIDLYQIEPLR